MLLLKHPIWLLKVAFLSHVSKWLSSFRPVWSEGTERFRRMANGCSVVTVPRKGLLLGGPERDVPPYTYYTGMSIVVGLPGYSVVI